MGLMDPGTFEEGWRGRHGPESGDNAVGRKKHSQGLRNMWSCGVGGILGPIGPPENRRRLQVGCAVTLHAGHL